ncbi:hypothetical protein [Methylocystis sp.]|uniref:hypothetical protein n=1 Tax=Methylocystis sp. TaxID=1911079 RepID=UPI003D0A6E9E
MRSFSEIADRENYTALKLQEFFEVKSPAATADFENFTAKSLALSYDVMRRKAKKIAAVVKREENDLTAGLHKITDENGETWVEAEAVVARMLPVADRAA